MQEEEKQELNHEKILLYAYVLEHKHKPSKQAEISSLVLQKREIFQTEQMKHLLSSVSDSSFKYSVSEMSLAEANNIKVITFLDASYPNKLKQISDPPLVIFVKGNVDVLNSENPFFGIVGTRRASEYGLKVSGEISHYITRNGGVVVSGLALGVDSAAHYGAVSTCKELRTKSSQEIFSSGVAVIGSGINNIYPTENKKLADKILEMNGCLVSEYGVNTESKKEFFPFRNRIISGLSDAVIVTEAPVRSGAMITARLAAEEGRDVYAVPSQIFSGRSQGNFRLLKSGASLLTNFRDLETYFRRVKAQATNDNYVKSQEDVFDKKDDIEELSNIYSSESQFSKRSDLEKSLIDVLRNAPNFDVDSIAVKLGIQINEVLSALVGLEIDGIVQIDEANNYSLTELVDSF